MRYNVARSLKQAVRKYFGGESRPRPIRNADRFVKLSLEELEQRTPATS